MVSVKHMIHDIKQRVEKENNKNIVCESVHQGASAAVCLLEREGALDHEGDACLCLCTHLCVKVG